MSDPSPAADQPKHSLKDAIIDSFLDWSFKPLRKWARVEAGGVKAGWVFFTIAAILVCYGGCQWGKRGKAELRQERDTANTRLAPFLAAADVRYPGTNIGISLGLLATSITNLTAVNRELVIALMAQLNDSSGPEFRAAYPIGYSLFTITETKHVIPFDATPVAPFRVDWSGSESGIEMSKDSVVVTLPRLFIGVTPEQQRRPVRVERFHISFPRQVNKVVGALAITKEGGILMGIQKRITKADAEWILEAGVVSTRRDGVVVILGCRPLGYQ